MRYDPVALREQIFAAIPPGWVVAEHTEKEHFYRVKSHGNTGESFLYPSVTAKLQHLKDEGLANFKMNRALEYISVNYPKFTPANIEEHIMQAERMPADIFIDAGDVGTRIHDIREKIFTQWIETGIRPANFLGFITGDDAMDIRIESAIAALSKFCDDYSYIPVVTELYVYSHELKTGGALDDIGLMRRLERAGDRPECEHKSLSLNGVHESTIMEDPDRNIDRCFACGAKWKWLLVLLDVKTSNRFKDSYFFQVGLYFGMFRSLTRLKLDMSFILKLSKEDRTYKIEDLKRPAKLAQYGKYICRTNEGLSLIKELRKDNQRNVIHV